MRHIPLIAFLILALAVAFIPRENDITLWWIPAAKLLTTGADVYSLNARAPFVYPPFVLPLFAPFALPGAYQAMTLVNAGAAVALVCWQKASGWWLLYPPVLMALAFGSFDLPVVALALLAYRKRWPGVMALALLVKPQAAIFWCVPYVVEQPRVMLRMAATGAALVVTSVVLTPGAWGSWFEAVMAHPGELADHYINGSYSLFSIGLGIGALGGVLTLPRFREGQWRALTALLVPFTRYYSAVGLVGYAAPWAIALAWVLVLLAVAGLRVVWVEPLVVLGLSLYLGKSMPEKQPYV